MSIRITSGRWLRASAIQRLPTDALSMRKLDDPQLFVRPASGWLDYLLRRAIGIYTTIMHNKTMYYINHKLPLLLERVGVRRIKSISYIPPHPNLLPQGRRSGYLCRYLCRRAGCAAPRLPDYLAQVSPVFLSGSTLWGNLPNQFDPEFAAHANRVVNADSTAHLFDQLFGDHQADTRPFLNAGFLPEAIERLK